MVVRGDSTVAGVEVNIQDSNAGNDDAVTGQPNGNGLTNGVPVFVSATRVSPDPNLSAQYPSYPLEFRFTYAAVPNSGSATITVRLKGYTTSVYPNRFTTLTRTVNTVAPTQVVQISNPPSDGTVITMDSSSSLPDPDLFHFDAEHQQHQSVQHLHQRRLPAAPRSPDPILPYYFLTGTGCGSGMRLLTYNWSGAQPGTNVIEVIYTNSVILSDTRMVIVAPPLYISGHLR